MPLCTRYYGTCGLKEVKWMEFELELFARLGWVTVSIGRLRPMDLSLVLSNTI